MLRHRVATLQIFFCDLKKYIYFFFYLIIRTKHGAKFLQGENSRLFFLTHGIVTTHIRELSLRIIKKDNHTTF